ncbi:MAG: hypothetical protein JXA89_03970 [Anaerolineae bacterium]|nr:hypothetical protein [Anaerolineae bacterium]
MEQTNRYDTYPVWIVLVCNLVSIAIYVLGATILADFGWWVSGLYLLGCLWLEIRVLQKSCVNCIYYGKRCGTGKGRLCALLFKQGDPRIFAERTISWVDVLPDFLVSLVPLVGGIVLSFVAFSWLRLVAMFVLIGLAFGGSAALRGSLLCKYCKQGEIGCPAAQLFEKAQR